MSHTQSKTHRHAMAKFVTGISYDTLPLEVVSRAKLCILDLVGVALAGGSSEVGTLALQLAREMGSARDASVWGSGETLSAPAATFLNALRGHVMDMDDGHRFSAAHMAVVTVPVAVALAEREKLSGRAIIEGVVAGYEIGLALGKAINPAHLKRGFHTTATVGVFASAAVAAKMLKLSSRQTEHCLSLAGLQSAGLLEALTSGHMGKSFQVGRAAMNGIYAAFAARLGVEGPDLVIEGEDGFLRAYTDQSQISDASFKALGSSFQILGNYFKKHAACRHTHASLDAIEILKHQHAFNAEEVLSVEVETYSVAMKLTGKIPADLSDYAAKFSLPLSIGLMLVFGEAGPKVYCAENASHPLVRKIADRVSIRTSPERDNLYPGERGAAVTVRTSIGTFVQEVKFPKGEPENPLVESELVEKFRANCSTLLSPTETQQLALCILNLQKYEASDLAHLLNACAEAA